MKYLNSRNLKIVIRLISLNENYLKKKVSRFLDFDINAESGCDIYVYRYICGYLFYYYLWS